MRNFGRESKQSQQEYPAHAIETSYTRSWLPMLNCRDAPSFWSRTRILPLQWVLCQARGNRLTIE
jgi:hypothetical protein